MELNVSSENKSIEFDLDFEFGFENNNLLIKEHL